MIVIFLRISRFATGPVDLQPDKQMFLFTGPASQYTHKLKFDLI